ncbi:MAG: methylmalonyl-CoA epimerase [Chloroflexi bacterium]|nr:methylmalonyl-CoA epimerase [Chloroflexota bacterium]
MTSKTRRGEKKLDHVAVAVKDMASTLRFYQEVMGISPSHQAVLPQQGVKVAFLPVGDSAIELLEPTDPQGAVARFLERRGEGLHHICFQVADIDAELRSLAQKGVELIDKEPRPGAEGRVGFLHPRNASGVLIELVQKD